MQENQIKIIKGKKKFKTKGEKEIYDKCWKSKIYQMDVAIEKDKELKVTMPEAVLSPGSIRFICPVEEWDIFVEVVEEVMGKNAIKTNLMWESSDGWRICIAEPQNYLMIAK